MATICCWLATRESGLRTVAALLEDREEVVDLGEVPEPLDCPPVSADQQVLFDAQRGEEFPSLRHHGDAHGHDIGRGQGTDVVPVKADHAGGGLQKARDRPHQR